MPKDSKTASYLKIITGIPGKILAFIGLAVLIFEFITSPPGEERLISSNWTFDRSGDRNHLLPMTLDFQPEGLILPLGPNGETDEITNERKWNIKPPYLGGDLVIMSSTNDVTTIFKYCFKETLLLFGKYECSGEPFGRGGHTHYLVEK